MQCKHQISINKQFDIQKIDKCWHQRMNISKSSNHGSYVSPRIFSINLSIYNDESNMDICDNKPSIFENNMINANDPDKTVDIIDLNNSNNTLSHKSFTVICDGLYNSMENNKSTSTFVIGMLLEIKRVISSPESQNLDLNRMLTHFDNFKTTFTPLAKESNLILNEPKFCSMRTSTKRILSNFEKKTKRIKSDCDLLTTRKVVSCGFCGISGHRTTGYAYKFSIGTEIRGDDLIEYLEKYCPFKVIDSEQASNVYRVFLNNRTKIKHIR